MGRAEPSSITWWVRYTRGPWTKELLVGACDGPVDAETVAHFRDAVCTQVSTEREPELVYRGGPLIGATPRAVKRFRPG